MAESLSKLLLGSVFSSVGSITGSSGGVLGGVGSILCGIGGGVGSTHGASGGSVCSGSGCNIGSSTGSGSSSSSGVGNSSFTGRGSVGSSVGCFGGGFLGIGGRIGGLFLVASRHSEDASGEEYVKLRIHAFLQRSCLKGNKGSGNASARGSPAFAGLCSFTDLLGACQHHENAAVNGRHFHYNNHSSNMKAC